MLNGYYEWPPVRKTGVRAPIAQKKKISEMTPDEYKAFALQLQIAVAEPTESELKLTKALETKLKRRC